MMHNKSEIADIMTWRTPSDDSNKQWRGELRFRTEEPDSPIGFSVYRTADTQDKVVAELMELYKGLVLIMEAQHTIALGYISRHVEDVAEEKRFIPSPFPKYVRTYLKQDLRKWVGI